MNEAGRRKLLEGGFTNFKVSKLEVEFLRHAIINWLMYADVEIKFDTLSKEEIHRLEEKLISLSDWFEKRSA